MTVTTTMSASYTTGPYTVSVSADDADPQAWDASVAMVSGDITTTIAADEASNVCCCCVRSR